jgi:hypothetical protein
VKTDDSLDGILRSRAQPVTYDATLRSATFGAFWKSEALVCPSSHFLDNTSTTTELYAAT